MATKTKAISLNQMMQSVGDCFTAETAKRLANLKADPSLQARVDVLAEKCSDGTLTEKERDEYRRYVSFGTFVDTLKSKARLVLKQSRAKS